MTNAIRSVNDQSIILRYSSMTHSHNRQKHLISTLAFVTICQAFVTIRQRICHNAPKHMSKYVIAFVTIPQSTFSQCSKACQITPKYLSQYPSICHNIHQSICHNIHQNIATIHHQAFVTVSHSIFH